MSQAKRLSRKPVSPTAQPKTAGTPQMRKLPTAPPVYRPQPVPLVLQAKKANGSRVADAFPRAQAAHAPQRKPPAAPPAFKSQPAPRVLQTKTPNAASAPVWPRANHPTLRPPHAHTPVAARHCVQPKSGVGQRPPLANHGALANHVAPQSHRPQAKPNAVQPKPGALPAKPPAAHTQLAPRPAARPGFAAVQLKRPTGVAPSRAVFPSNRSVIQRMLDEDFEYGGTPKRGETAACRAFAKKVSDFVDQAYDELISGNVKAWKGAKAATFLELLLNGHNTAKTHAANAIEERVYALMLKTDMKLKWVPQYTEGMGGASKPDIVIHLESGNEALVDITSARGHILGKAGGWTTSKRYIYVAEAYFPPICQQHIANIKDAIEKGGINLEGALKLRSKADAERKKKLKTLLEERRIVREAFREYGSFSSYALAQFSYLPKGQRLTAASQYLRENGIVVKGMRRTKGKRKPSPETLKKKKATARRVRAAKEKKSAKELLATIQKPNLTVPMKRSTRRTVVPKKKATDVVIKKFL